MLFFASGVCENGCTLEKAGIMAIVSGLMWMFAAALAYKSAPMDRSAPKSSCCCCPLPISRIAPGESAYKAVPINEELSVEEAPEEKALIRDDEVKGEEAPEGNVVLTSEEG